VLDKKLEEEVETNSIAQEGETNTVDIEVIDTAVSVRVTSAQPHPGAKFTEIAANSSAPADSGI